MHRFLPLLLLLCLLMSGCTQVPGIPTAEELPPAAIPAPAADNLPQSRDQATFWFRYGTEPLLAPETREITHSRTESHALALLRALMEGPSAAAGELNSLFPAGTQVLSVTQSGRIMFVTLSRHIMKRFADEPANWRDQPVWAAEVPLRRELAMQSIAATLTENCQVDTVVILVEQSGTDSLRLRQGYYSLDDDNRLAAPLVREERLLLSPSRTAEVILTCWNEGDYARLYRYVAAVDPATDTSRPEEAAFIEHMHAEPHLLRASVTGGSITMDGQRAVFTVSGAYLLQGTEHSFSNMVLQLVREKGLWKIGHTQLRGSY